MKTRFNRREFSLGALAASTALAERRPPDPRTDRAGEDSRRLGGGAGLAGAADPGEEGHSQALRPILRRRGDPLRRHAAGHHRAGVRRARHRAAGVLLLRACHPERPHGRPARHQRRNPGRRRGPRHQRIHGAQGWAGQNRGRPQGQGARHQRHGQRRRHRHAGDAARRTASKPTRTTPSSRRPSRPCARCCRRRRPT